MKCPSSDDGSCPSTDPLEVHHTDEYSTYYCQTCGHEEKIVWETPKDSPKNKERTRLEPSPPKKKLKRGK
jgi:Zn ribbon nucleic-acid-binding protein